MKALRKADVGICSAIGADCRGEQTGSCAAAWRKCHFCLDPSVIPRVRS